MGTTQYFWAINEIDSGPNVLNLCRLLLGKGGEKHDVPLFPAILRQ